MLDLSFYKSKKVLITGHTGFKGSWMCEVLLYAGATVIGYALNPPTEPSLFELCNLQDRIISIEGDIRDLDRLYSTFQKFKPEIVIHMAAQPIVRESYKNPVYTYETNVMGTVNILECIRLTESVKSFVNVTTDKVYKNKEWVWGYRENEELNGYDPYSNSKSCSELVTESYKKSFFQGRDIAISTCRAGNVIGGGDFAMDRIIPDCVRAGLEKKEIIVRNPFSVRPYQHVLEPVMAYLLIAKEQYMDNEMAGNYNIGPDEVGCWNTGELVTLFCRKWKEITGEKIELIDLNDGGPHESNYLKLDCSKMKNTFNWKPKWNMEIAIEKVIEWTENYRTGKKILNVIEHQIHEYITK